MLFIHMITHKEPFVIDGCFDIISFYTEVEYFNHRITVQSKLACLDRQ